MMAPDDRPTDAEVARAAIIQSVASNVAMLAVVVAVNVAVAKRDAITRAGRRAVAVVRQEAGQGRIPGELAAFRRDVTLISHLPPERRADEP